MLFSQIQHMPRLRSSFCYYKQLERVKMNHRISKVLGSRSWETKILTMINVQKWQILSISENSTNVYVYFTSFIPTDIHILDAVIT